MATWNVIDSETKAELNGNFEIELDLTGLAGELELRVIEAGGSVDQPSTGKQVSLIVDGNTGNVKARYFNDQAWVGL